MIPRKIFEQKCFHRNRCSKGFARFRINVSGGVHLQKSCRKPVFNLTEDRLHLIVPLEILKIFRTTISWTPAATYFHHHVMPRSFLLVNFDMYLFLLNVLRTCACYKKRHRSNISRTQISFI